jgi:hypothetical protein
MINLKRLTLCVGEVMWAYFLSHAWEFWWEVRHIWIWLHFDILIHYSYKVHLHQDKLCTHANHNIHDFVQCTNKSTLCLNLLAQNVLEGDGISREFGDALAELLDGHLVLVEEKAEFGLVVDVGLLLDVEVGGIGGIELLGDVVLRVVELLEQVGLRELAGLGLCTRLQ